MVLNLFKVISRRVEDVRRHGGRLARGHDIDGGNPYVSAKGAGHSKETKARYYKKVSYEEAQESYARQNPLLLRDGKKNQIQKINTIKGKMLWPSWE